MKLTYWVIPHQHDSAAYNIRAKTRKAALAEAAAHWEKTAYPANGVKKVTVEYDNALDLLTQCLEEGGACWEPYS